MLQASQSISTKNKQTEEEGLLKGGEAGSSSYAPLETDLTSQQKASFRCACSSQTEHGPPCHDLTIRQTHVLPDIANVSWPGVVPEHEQCLFNRSPSHHRDLPHLALTCCLSDMQKCVHGAEEASQVANQRVPQPGNGV
jgi:hypothetical protein